MEALGFDAYLPVMRSNLARIREVASTLAPRAHPHSILQLMPFLLLSLRFSHWFLQQQQAARHSARDHSAVSSSSSATASVPTAVAAAPPPASLPPPPLSTANPAAAAPPYAAGTPFYSQGYVLAAAPAPDGTDPTGGVGMGGFYPSFPGTPAGIDGASGQAAFVQQGGLHACPELLYPTPTHVDGTQRQRLLTTLHRLSVGGACAGTCLP